MQRYPSLFLAGIAMVCIFFYTQTWAANEAVLKARNSVVRVIAFDENGNGSRGTGFAVGEEGKPVRYFVTNSHVIAADPKSNFYPTGIAVIFEDVTKEESIYLARVIYASKSFAPDVAILDIGTPVNFRKPSKLLPAGNVRETDDIYAIGFPGTADDINDGGRKKLPSQPENATTSKGIITKLKISNGNTACYQIDAVINHGNSGGPLVTEDGYIIGINTFGAIEGEGTNGAIYIDAMFPLFRKYHIPYTLAEAKTKQEATPDTLTDLVGAVGIGVIIIAAAFGKGDKASCETPEFQFQDQPGELSQPFLIGISGECAGKRFPLHCRKITIGRDAGTCNVVFNDSTQGISFRHCEVSYNSEADCFIIIDLGSTFGTFRGGGQRLEAGMPGIMKAGEAFYLATPYNKFVLQTEE